MTEYMVYGKRHTIAGDVREFNAPVRATSEEDAEEKIKEQFDDFDVEITEVERNLKNHGGEHYPTGSY